MQNFAMGHLGAFLAKWTSWQSSLGQGTMAGLARSQFCREIVTREASLDCTTTTLSGDPLRIWTQSKADAGENPSQLATQCHGCHHVHIFGRIRLTWSEVSIHQPLQDP